MAKEYFKIKNKIIRLIGRYEDTRPVPLQVVVTVGSGKTSTPSVYSQPPMHCPLIGFGRSLQRTFNTLAVIAPGM